MLHVSILHSREMKSVLMFSLMKYSLQAYLIITSSRFPSRDGWWGRSLSQLKRIGIEIANNLIVLI